MATTNNQKRSRKITSFTISDEAREKLRKQSDQTGITQSRIVEKLIERMEGDPKLTAIVCKMCAEEDFEKWATSHNRQYVDNAKISVFVPEAEREPERKIQEQDTQAKAKEQEELERIQRMTQEEWERDFAATVEIAKRKWGIQ